MPDDADELVEDFITVVDFTRGADARLDPEAERTDVEAWVRERLVPAMTAAGLAIVRVPIRPPWGHQNDDIK